MVSPVVWFLYIKNQKYKTMQKQVTYGILIVNVILLGLFFSSTLKSDETSDSKDDKTVLDAPINQIINPVSVPESLTFAGERVPLEIEDVKERLDRELLVNTYWHSNTIQLFKRASRDFPIIEKILAENEMPDDFKYLALAESGLLNVVSPMSAGGYWQILEPTAKEYGLEVSSEVDERRHIEKATQAAVNYLKKAKARFGSWALATASYNIGQPRLASIVEVQKTTSYYDLYLNEETSRYVFRIIALKEVFNNPERYGFYLDKTDLYQPYQYREVEIDSSINDLAAFAASQGANYKTMKILNPWLTETHLYNKSRKTYTIKLPI